MCTWKELKDGSLDVRDLLAMHRVLNLKDYIEMQQQGAAR